jgi:hypothetical protein
MERFPMKKAFRIALVVAAIVTVGAPRSAFADKGGKHHGRNGVHTTTANNGGKHRGRKGFHTTTVDKHRGLPPGLAKRDSLPPGLARQLRERGRLPPGLQKRLTPVPSAWGRPYSALPPHHARYFSGRDLVVVNTRTHRVVSIVRNAR